MTQVHLALARKLSVIFSQRPEVTAIALGGSVAVGAGSASSDIDLYIFCHPIVPLSCRKQLVTDWQIAEAELNLQFWDTGDAWFDPKSGIEVDIMYWQPGWIESMLKRVIDQHQPSLGYTTCFWFTIKHAIPLFDRSGWLATLKQTAKRPYPDALRKNIIAKNLAVLGQVIPAYRNQIQKACQRNDLISLNHRIAGFLASYFDVLFAINRELHPGEKRLLQKALASCPLRPLNLSHDIESLLNLAAKPGIALMNTIDRLINDIENLAAKHN